RLGLRFGSGQSDRTHQIISEFCWPFRPDRVANREGSPPSELAVFPIFCALWRFWRFARSAIGYCQWLRSVDLAEALSGSVKSRDLGESKVHPPPSKT